MKTSIRPLLTFLTILVVCLIALNAQAGRKQRTSQKVARSNASPAATLSSLPSCIPPGTSIVSDPTGDQNGAPVANQQFDIQSLSIAEQCFADGLDKLTFTIKVANLSSIPANGHWKVRFVFGPTTYFVE